MLSTSKLMPTSDGADAIELDLAKIQETLSNKPGTEAMLGDVNAAFNRFQCFYHREGSWCGSADRHSLGSLRLGAEQ